MNPNGTQDRTRPVFFAPLSTGFLLFPHFTEKGLSGIIQVKKGPFFRPLKKK